MNYPEYSDHVAWQELESNVVIIELEGKRLFHQLDDVGSHIWKLCDGNHKIDDITASVLNEFTGPDEAVIKTETCGFISELTQKGLIKWKEN